MENRTREQEQGLQDTTRRARAPPPLHGCVLSCNLCAMWRSLLALHYCVLGAVHGYDGIRYTYTLQPCLEEYTYGGVTYRGCTDVLLGTEGWFSFHAPSIWSERAAIGGVASTEEERERERERRIFLGGHEKEER